MSGPPDIAGEVCAKQGLFKEAGLDVSRETIEKLFLYETLLIKWQKTINLVGPGTLNDIWGRHFLDSAQLLPVGRKGASVYDLGSGAGFPGMVLALLSPDVKVALIESDQRKCSFLSHVSRETGAQVDIYNERIEGSSLLAPDVVVSRALAPLSVLLGFVSQWSGQNPDLVCVFMKGAGYEKELAAAQAKHSFDLTVIQSICGQGFILKLTKIALLCE